MMKKKATALLLVGIFLLFAGNVVKANNIAVTNISLTGQNTGSDYTIVQFDLSWENSWRISNGPANWDAAWVFVKYSTDGITWNHAYINNDGYTSPEGCTMYVGLVDERDAFHPRNNPGVGVFIYREADGTGTFNSTGIKIRWNYGANDVEDDAVIDVRVYAIEMVYVPEGSFSLGSGGSEISAFYKYPTGTNPYLVSSEAAINVGATNNYLYYLNSANGGDRSGPIPDAFPKGYAGFYMMKYELSQQAYVDFLNNLPIASTSSHFANINSHRNGIIRSTITGLYETSMPYVSCNFLSWDDGTAYADWAGLRPFSELEFEKACRGDQSPVANQYAWGTAYISDEAYTINNIGMANEGIAANYNITGSEGNVSYSSTNGNINGPLRGGIFAAHPSNSGRVTSGASYYGIYELSGNLWERAVNIGNAAGRAFTGLHGNGSLNNASHDVISWPSGIAAIGSGFRGGGWVFGTSDMRVSDRYNSCLIPDSRYQSHGFRCARSVPIPLLD